MDKTIDLTKILKNCPKGTEFWSKAHGVVSFQKINLAEECPIYVKCAYGIISLTSEGKYFKEGECILIPSKDQRDWNKFSAPWYKKEKFDPKTLQPFDKVLVKCTSIYNSNLVWRAELFSYFYVEDNSIRVYTLGSDDNSPKSYVIPYNDDTKHLVNTEIEAPEYYRYWE